MIVYMCDVSLETWLQTWDHRGCVLGPIETGVHRGPNRFRKLTDTHEWPRISASKPGRYGSGV